MLKFHDDSFAFLEVQSLDLSGSSWWEVERLKSSLIGSPLPRTKHKPVGPNWQMSVKTLFSEILKKGKITEAVGSTLFVALQDGLWDYISSHYEVQLNGKGLAWMIYEINSNGNLALKKQVEMDYNSFVLMLHSEVISTPQEIYRKLEEVYAN